MEQGRAGGNGVYDSIALEPARNFDFGAGRCSRPRARAVIHALMCYSMHSPGDGPSVPPAPDLINPMLHRVHDITHESLPRTPPSASVSPFPSPETLNPFSRLLHTP